ncbi:MAG TPA: alanine-zipper protein [Stellaceae bacterium]|jgi:outer membrane biogenesis lipoprotein LolB
MVRKVHLALLLVAPLALAACSSGRSSEMSSVSSSDQQALATSQQALQTAQQAQSTANEAKAEADRMGQRNLQK